MDAKRNFASLPAVPANGRFFIHASRSHVHAALFMVEGLSSSARHAKRCALLMRRRREQNNEHLRRDRMGGATIRFLRPQNGMEGAGRDASSMQGNLHRFEFRRHANVWPVPLRLPQGRTRTGARLMRCPRCGSTLREIDPSLIWLRHFICDECDTAYHFQRNEKQFFLVQGRRSPEK